MAGTSTFHQQTWVSGLALQLIVGSPPHPDSGFDHPANRNWMKTECVRRVAVTSHLPALSPIWKGRPIPEWRVRDVRGVGRRLGFY